MEQRRLRQQVAEHGGPAGGEVGVGDVGVLPPHAPGSGDDTIVEVARSRAADGWDVTVVTADRELKGRVEAAGARTVGPSWLLDRL